MDLQGRQTERAWIKSKRSSTFAEMMRSSSSGRLDQSDNVCCFEDSCSFETCKKKKIHNLEKQISAQVLREVGVVTLSERREDTDGVFFSVVGSVVLAGCFDFTT